MIDDLEYPRSILRDLHRDAILRGHDSGQKYTNADIADRFVVVARGLDDLQTPEVRDAIYRAWAIREGAGAGGAKQRAIRGLRDEGVAVLVHYARNGVSGEKPLRLFTHSETSNTRDFFVQTAAQYSTRAALWIDAAHKHDEHPDLPLGDVLDPLELAALADATLDDHAETA